MQVFKGRKNDWVGEETQSVAIAGETNEERRLGMHSMQVKRGCRLTMQKNQNPEMKKKVM
jgi:hypothetical protein